FSRFGLDISQLLPRRLGGFATMGLEQAGRGKLTQLMAHHIFVNKHREELLPVMHCNGQSDHFRHDHGSAAPRLDYLAVATGLGGVNPRQKTFFHKGSLRYTAWHIISGSSA